MSRAGQLVVSRTGQLVVSRAGQLLVSRAEELVVSSCTVCNISRQPQAERLMHLPQKKVAKEPAEISFLMFIF